MTNMQNLISDNAVIIVAAFFVFALLLFRKELQLRLKNLKIDEKFLASLDYVFKISSSMIDDIVFIEKILSDGKLTPEEIRDLLIRFGARKAQLEELIEQ